MVLTTSHHGRVFTEKARGDYDRFCAQKTADFRSLLLNYVQLQMHVHRKVGVALWVVWRGVVS